MQDMIEAILQNGICVQKVAGSANSTKVTFKTCKNYFAEVTHFVEMAYVAKKWLSMQVQQNGP